MNKILEARGICKSYAKGAGALEILKSVDLSVAKGEGLCIVGSSGAGKSTLLHILGTLDRPNKGQLFFEGKDVSGQNDGELANLRNRKMGFVFQFHHLLPEFTALENVMMPCRIAGVRNSEAESKASALLKMLGLSDRHSHYPSQLSGGEQQRVAIARALVRQPQILFADEPTGNLDSTNGEMIQELFFELQEKLGLTLLVATHDPGFAKKFKRCQRLVDGRWSE